MTKRKRFPHHYDWEYGHQWAVSHDGTEVECVLCAATKSSSFAKQTCWALRDPEPKDPGGSEG